MTATVVINGSPYRAVLYLGSGLPSGPAPRSFALTESSPGTWSVSFPAPTQPGEYHFTVGLFNAKGNRHIADNDGWNIQVLGVATSTTTPTPTQTQTPSTIPGDIPLAPPFSYGNPQVAVFSAEGQSVSGSELSSNSRPDVSATSVLQFYETRFPRSGWTVDPATIPGVVGRSFSLTATSPSPAGTRVCVVQYAAGIVYIYYGKLGG
jgi:hypothetical protein